MLQRLHAFGWSTVFAQPRARWRWAALHFLLALMVAYGNCAKAQTNRPPARIGELWGGTEAQAAPWRQRYLEGMTEFGWVDGQAARFLPRYDDGNPDRMPALAKELVAQGVDVLVVTNGSLAAARQATATLPIICVDMYDPVLEGVAVSLSRPGGNVSGVSWQSIDSAAKRLELAKELIPNLRRVALLSIAEDPGAAIEAKGLREFAAKAAIQLRIFGVRNADELPRAFADIAKYRPGALFVSVNALTVQNLDQIARFAATNRLPAISEVEEFAEAGFLLTYGANLADTSRQAAMQVDRILKGRKVAELPFEQPTKFDLTINRKSARTLGLKIPNSIVVRTTREIR